MRLDLPRACAPNALEGFAPFEPIRIGDDVYSRCPKAWLRDACASVEDEMRACGWMLSERGPPNAGGMEDQPVRFLMALAIADAAMEDALELRKKIAAKNRKRAERPRRSA